jgi:hypothetical protein
MTNSEDGSVPQKEAQTFEPDPETELMLLESMTQSDRGRTVPFMKVWRNFAAASERYFPS